MVEQIEKSKRLLRDDPREREREREAVAQRDLILKEMHHYLCQNY